MAEKFLSDRFGRPAEAGIRCIGKTDREPLFQRGLKFNFFNFSLFLCICSLASPGATRQRQGVERAKTLIPGHKHQYDTIPSC